MIIDKNQNFFSFGSYGSVYSGKWAFVSISYSHMSDMLHFITHCSNIGLSKTSFIIPQQYLSSVFFNENLSTIINCLIYQDAIYLLSTNTNCASHMDTNLHKLVFHHHKRKHFSSRHF